MLRYRHLRNRVTHTLAALRNYAWKRALEIVLKILGVSSLSVIAVTYFLMQQPFDAVSEIDRDLRFSRQGIASMKWTVHLQPRRWHRLMSQYIGCYAHLEVRPSASGALELIDLSSFERLRFSAKSSREFMLIKEFNVFVDTCYCQYMDTASVPFCTLYTRWQTYEIKFRDLYLAPWDRRDKKDCCGEDSRLDAGKLAKVMALGWDVKVRTQSLKDRVWFDNVRLVDSTGREVLLASADSLVESFKGSMFMWVSDWNKYVDF